MAQLNLIEDIKNVEQRLSTPEDMLGKELLQPFSCMNSGARKILHANQIEQRLVLMEPEMALLQTGHENEFGKYSSSFIRSDNYYEVVQKIDKFSNKPNDHYYLILKNDIDKTLHVIERVSYSHITESYGYMINNTELDRLSVGSEIHKDQVICKSKAFDEYNNRMDGVNLITAYMSCELTIEDGIVISESAAKKLTSPLLKKVSIIINDNDIPLNMYGDENVYKAFPDIGENIVNSLLCVIRRDKKDESLYSQSYNRLRDIMMSDDKYTLNGKVIDIDIMCNNPEKIKEVFYNNQLAYYYNDSIRMYTEFVNAVNTAVAETGYTMTYELQKLYYNFNKILNGGQFINERLFSNIIIEFMILEESQARVGDKLTDRYGGKGTIGFIFKDEMMPMLDTGETVELIKNQNTCFNRENPAQLIELTLNHISSRIAQFIYCNICDLSECIGMIHDFYEVLDPKLAEYFEKRIESLDNDEDAMMFLSSICSDNGIFISLEPISSGMNLDKISQLYKKFPWAKLNSYKCPIKDSNGNIRYIEGRRPITAGRIYTYRLKQYAEEKHSVTSLSSTNIKNENSRNKANRSYKASYARTPIRFGNMEIGDLLHIGAETVIVNLLLYSSSPHARRLVSQLLTGDPFKIDIRLDESSKNRSVEIVQAYLKTMGLRLQFKKIPKKLIKPIKIDPVRFAITKRPYIKPIKFVEDKDYENPAYIKPVFISPIEFTKAYPDNKVKYDLDKDDKFIK